MVRGLVIASAPVLCATWTPLAFTAVSRGLGAPRHRHLAHNVAYAPVEEFVIGDEPPRRIADALTASGSEAFPTVTAAKRLVRRRQIWVNGEACNTSLVVRSGDVVQRMERVGAAKFQSRRDIPEGLTVLYEDGELGVVFKPAGMAVHGGPPDTDTIDEKSGRYAPRKSLRSYLPSLLTPTEVVGALRRPIHVHRLDRATSAKSRNALRILSQRFRDRQIVKRYRAILIGVPEGIGDPERTGFDIGKKRVLSGAIDGKPALTEFSVVNVTRSLRFDFLTTVDMWPKTGRKHQLRRHAADLLKCPILGDTKYELLRCPDGATGLSHGMGLHLCAVELQFEHPMKAHWQCCRVSEVAQREIMEKTPVA